MSDPDSPETYKRLIDGVAAEASSVNARCVRDGKWRWSPWLFRESHNPKGCGSGKKRAG